MSALWRRDLVATAAGLAAGEYSALELAEHYLARIARLEPRVNAWMAVTADEARTAAGAADARRAAGRPRGLLDGIPVGLKDNIDCAGMPATAGMALYRDHVPAADAPATAALKHAGAVILGKQGMHEGAMGTSPFNPHFGATQNPHRAGYSPGGSSTGGGAALAAGLCAAALGTDTLGSVRLPAAYSGIASLLPTPGRISLDGVLPLAWSLDAVGPMARSARDLAPLLAVLAEPRPARPVADLTIGVLPLPEAAGVVPAVAAAFDAALAMLRRQGLRVVRADLAGVGLTDLLEAGLVILRAEAAAVHAANLKARPEGYSAPMRERLAQGAGFAATAVVRAWRTRRRAMQAVREALGACDVLAMPTTPFPAPAFAGPDPLPAMQPVFTALGNVAACPAVSVPMGRSPDRLPLGLQLVGLPGSDETLIALAAAYEAAAGHAMAPAGWD